MATNANELDYSRKVADGERLELIMRQVASRFKLDGNVLAEALLDIHERLKAVEGATEELTSSDRWKAFKTVQPVKPSPSASGDTVTAIDTVAQDENGELTATKKNIRQGTTSQTGIVQLSDATNSTSTTLAATANAVKKAYDLASNAKPKQTAKSSPTASGSDIAFIDTITQDANGVVTATKKTVRSASASQSGVMSAEHFSKLEDLPTDSELQADLSGKADKVSDATAGDVATLDANGNLVDSGKTLGTSVPADAVFTDDKVAQMKADSSDTAYPLLIAGTTDPSGRKTVARYDSGVTLNPSTNTISANISGNATTATTASATSSGSISDGDDLNSYNTANRNYICNASNASTVTNKPSGASGAFELEVIRGTGSTCVQVYYSRDDVNFNYIRKCTGLNNVTWTSWVKLIDSSDVISPNYSAATLAYDASGESLLFNLSKVSVYGEIVSTLYCQLKIVPKSGSIRTDRSVIKSFNSNFDSFRIYNYPWSSSPGSNAYTPNIQYDNNNIGTIDIDLVTTQTVVIHLTVWYIADTAAGLYRFYIVEEVKT